MPAQGCAVRSRAAALLKHLQGQAVASALVRRCVGHRGAHLQKGASVPVHDRVVQATDAAICMGFVAPDIAGVNRDTAVKGSHL